MMDNLAFTRKGKLLHLIFQHRMGYDINRFQGDVDEELICPICSGVLEDPLQVECIHDFFNYRMSKLSWSINVNVVLNEMNLLISLHQRIFFHYEI